MGSQGQRAGQHVDCLMLGWDSFGRHTGHCRFISSCDGKSLAMFCLVCLACI